MNRSKLLSIAVIALFVINLGTLAVVFFSPRSAGHFEERPPCGEGPKRLIIARLGFNQQQQDAYELMVDEHRRKTRELNQASRQLHQELYALLIDKVPDQTKAETIIEEISFNQKAVDHLNLEHFQKIKALCKGEQLEKFNQLANDLERLFAPGPPH